MLIGYNLFHVLVKINNNAYEIDFLIRYGVNNTFDVTNLYFLDACGDLFDLRTKKFLFSKKKGHDMNITI